MEAKEIRLNNWILIGKDEVQIIELYQDECKSARGIVPYDAVHGIPLSEEWLMRFGFERVKGWEALGMWGKGELKVWWYGEKHRKDVMLHSCKPSNFKYQYVHQLQNLHFALTGTELPTNKP